MGIDQLREQICKKDLDIIRLISERNDLAKQIGESKKADGLPIVNHEVEKKRSSQDSSRTVPPWD